MLRRILGTRDITLFAIACIIGTRWIPAAAHAGPGAILLWLLGALGLSIPLSIAVAALTVRHPQAGGMYVWAKQDFGPLHGFLCFWLYWLGIVVWFPGAAMFYVGAATGTENRTLLLIAALAAIWIGLGANIRGVQTGQKTANAGAAASWLLASILVIAAIRRHGSATTFHLIPAFDWDTVSFWAAIAFAMSGMELVGLMGAEIRDPARTIPRAAWMASIVTTVFYAGSTAAMLVLLRPDQVNELDGLNRAGEVVGMPAIVAVLVLLSAIGQFGGQGAAVSRMPFAAGVDGLLPKAFGRIHPRWQTPHISMLVLGLLASVLLVVLQIGDTVRAAYDTIVSLMVVIGFIPYLYIFGSSWKAAHRFSASVGIAVTVLAILCGLVPPSGVNRVWVFEAKIAAGTAAAIASGLLLRVRRKSSAPDDKASLYRRR
ncbi:MAG TPA: APC family permease [Bryobacteraceae bacterium]|nr:APC family permease [Bryobacteraceae bacterium]